MVEGVTGGARLGIYFLGFFDYVEREVGDLVVSAPALRTDGGRGFKSRPLHSPHIQQSMPFIRLSMQNHGVLSELGSLRHRVYTFKGLKSDVEIVDQLHQQQPPLS